MFTRSWRCLFTIVFVGLAVTCNHAAAWESDVHYGLTKWLALQAGYSPDDAEVIAGANQGVDDSWLTGPLQSTAIAACLQTPDPSGAKIVHDHHFASELDPPDSPANRKLNAGAIWKDVRPRIVPQSSDGNSFLTNLGQYLHSLQDSWSHQGEPDTPPFCDPNYAFGHSRPRGGWACHLADYTYRWPADAETMAKATYEVLKGARPDLVPQPWTDVERELGAFIGAATKSDKDSWFAERGLEDTSFVGMTSLPDCFGANCEYTYRKHFDWWERIKASSESSVVPQKVYDHLTDFFKLMAKAYPDKYLLEFVDGALASAALARNLRVEEPCPELELLLVLMIGEGMLTGDGARAPEYFCEASINLEQEKRASPFGNDAAADNQAISCGWAKDFVRKSLDEPPLKRAPVPILPISFDFFIGPGRTVGTFVGVARFIHLPNQALVAIADERPRIIELSWLPRR